MSFTPARATFYNSRRIATERPEYNEIAYRLKRARPLMRVLDLTTLYIDGGEGGVNTYLREKAKRLSAHPEVEHVIIVPGRHSASTNWDSSTVHKLRSPALPQNPQHRVIANLRHLKGVVQAARPDLVEVDCSYILGRVARSALGPKVPIAGFYHADLPELYDRPSGALRRSITRRTRRWAWRYTEYCVRPCDRIIVASKHLRKQIAPQIGCPVEVVPLGVDLEVFRPLAPTESRPGIPGVDRRRPVILFVGRLSPEKELAVVFEVQRRLHESVGAQLVVCGDGPLRSQLQRRAAAQPGLVYLGAYPHGTALAGLYRAADVLLSPGRSETFGLTVLEAHATGLPVVAADAGGPSEILQDGGGTLIPPGDIDGFVEATRVAMTSSRTGRPRDMERHSWTTTFDRLLEVYGAMVEETRSRNKLTQLAAKG